MKPYPFKYLVASSLAHALALKAEHGDEAKFLAGGQSLMPTMNFRLARPAILIDINRLEDLAKIEVDGANAMRIGALTRYRSLESNVSIAQRYPLIAEALPHIAHPQIRNRGTIGGSLSHADPASEMPALMVALGARFLVKSSNGERWIAASGFFLGLLTTDLNDDEMLVEIELPQPRSNSGSCFMEVARRRGDYAIAGVAAMVTLGDAGAIASSRLVFCGVGEMPVDASKATSSLIGESMESNALNEALKDISANVQDMVEPEGSVHATADYQRHLAGVLTRRALATAHQRAQHGN